MRFVADDVLDRTEFSITGERPVTVCIAALFTWNYGVAGSPPELAMGAITVSDRMLTAGDMQYEPPQLKLAHITERTIILISGEYPLHSEAVQKIKSQIRGGSKSTTENIATLYGIAVQDIKRRHAEAAILAPLNLNTDSFIAQQRDMAPDFVNLITGQLQRYDVERVDALVIGVEPDGSGHLFNIDNRGKVSDLRDLGFGAIGTGSSHAKSILMQAGYINRFSLAQALAATFAAKKAAEVAPGVGRATDIQIILKQGHLPLWENMSAKLNELYEVFDKRRRALALEAVEELQNFIAPPKPENPDESKEEQ